MKKSRLTVAMLTVIFILFSSFPIFAKEYPVAPKENMGKKFRIIFLQGGPYYEYDLVFHAVILQLAKLGWVERMNIPSEQTQTAAKLYAWLAGKKDWSKYIEFPSDGFYDNEWKENLRKETMKKIGKRKGVDMVFALGTWAGQDMKNMPPEYNKVPIVVMDVSDPLRAKIVDNNEDSGRDNLTARVDPERYQRQVGLFHDIIGFKKLGMAFEDTVEGRSYAATDDVELIAKQRNFDIVKVLHPGYVESKEKAVKWMLESLRNLTPKIDAFYVTQQLAVDNESLPKMLKILNTKMIPTFSQAGSFEVKTGVLVSIATSGFKYVAEYHASKIAKILNGAKPRDLPILFEEPSNIAINLQTAGIIGFDPPVDILVAADEIFTE